MDNTADKNAKFEFIEPEIQVIQFNDDLILADSDRCCGWMEGFSVGYE